MKTNTNKTLIKRIKEADECIIELIHFLGCYAETTFDLEDKTHTNYIKNKYMKEEK